MHSELRYRKGGRIGDRYLVHPALRRWHGRRSTCASTLEEEDLPPRRPGPPAGDTLTSPKAMEYFEREVATWAALEKHPNIVRCHYLDKFENIPFLFLEWVAGEERLCAPDLRVGWFRRDRLEPTSPPQSSPSMSAAALEHARRRVPGLVHCDIKPENVLVAQGRLAKLTDFGLAKLVRQAGASRPPKNSPATVGGRWHVASRRGHAIVYVRPEQWRGTGRCPHRRLRRGAACSTSSCPVTGRFRR